MSEVRILGISGSQRRGNSEFLTKIALDSAKSIGNVDTDFLPLRGKRINPCLACIRCYKYATFEHMCVNPANREDDAQNIFSRMLQADGIIISSPVYWGTPPAYPLKLLLDRSAPFEPLGLSLRNKVGGVIAVGYHRCGGQESVIHTIHNWMMGQDMIVAGVGADRPAKTGIGGFIGAIVTQGFPYPVSSASRSSLKASSQDEIGLSAVKSIGKRVAEIAKIVKLGLAELPDQELGWPVKQNIAKDMKEHYSSLIK